MKKVIIHIGGHKTGTSAIQAFCVSNSSKLEQMEIIYPLELLTDINVDGLQAHHGLVNFFISHNSFWDSVDLRPKNVADIGRYLKSLPRDKNILLSSENLTWLDGNAIDNFKELLHGYDVHIVFYVRRQDNALQGLYQTSVLHNNEFRIFDEYLESTHSIFEYDKIAARWQSTFGNEKVIVRVYEKDQLDHNDSKLDFIHVLGGILNRDIDVSNWNHESYVINHGTAENVVSLVSYYNSLTSGSKIVLKIKEIANSLYTDARGTYEQISPSQRKKLLASFEQSNWRLANEFLGREDGVLFYDLSIKQTDQEWNEKYNYKGSDFYSLLCDVIDYLSFDNKRADKLNNIENDSDLNSLPDVGTEKKDSNNKLKIHSQCTICEKQLLFECIDDFDSCRDSLVSSDCPLNQCVTRERSLAKVFFDLIPRETLFSKYIHEAAPSNRGLSMLLSSHCENYIKSGYFPKMPFGQILNDKVINQNLEKQTFENDFFDVVIHLDVMEHLFNPFAALKEIYRTLKPAGICLFTVPTYPSIVESKQVAFINETGELSIIGEPEYHGNPQRPEDGALVTWRYGYDLQALISRYTDFDVEIRRYQDKSSAVMGHMTEVYILRKSMNYGKLTNSKSRGEAV